MLYIAYHDYTRDLPDIDDVKVGEVRMFGPFTDNNIDTGFLLSPTDRAELWARQNLIKDEKHDWKIVELKTIDL